MSACVVKPENRLLITDPGATVELDTLPGHGRAMATARSGQAELSRGCPLDGSVVQPMPARPALAGVFPLRFPGLGCKARCSTGYRCCAWRVTTGLNPHYGADSDSVICVAPGVTVALANWPSLLEFFFFFFTPSRSRSAGKADKRRPSKWFLPPFLSCWEAPWAARRSGSQVAPLAGVSCQQRLRVPCDAAYRH